MVRGNNTTSRTHERNFGCGAEANLVLDRIDSRRLPKRGTIQRDREEIKSQTRGHEGTLSECDESELFQGSLTRDRGDWYMYFVKKLC